MTILRIALNTISGRPGKSRTCKRNRYPNRCKIDLTVLSGRVFLLRILDIRSERFSLEKTSIFNQRYQS